MVNPKYINNRISFKQELIMINTILFWAWIAWSLPMSIYRSQFRKIVYQDNHWSINIKPYFLKELKGLLGNIYPHNPEYIQKRNFYRFYLMIYITLGICYFLSKT